MTHRGPFQPRTFCDSVMSRRASQRLSSVSPSAHIPAPETCWLSLSHPALSPRQRRICHGVRAPLPDLSPACPVLTDRLRQRQRSPICRCPEVGERAGAPERVVPPRCPQRPSAEPAQRLGSFAAGSIAAGAAAARRSLPSGWRRRQRHCAPSGALSFSGGCFPLCPLLGSVADGSTIPDLQLGVPS